jgi:hypothetical protein
MTSWKARAASASMLGSTRSPLMTKVASTPISTKALAYSAPVAPDPTTTRCWGSSLSEYRSRLERMTSPSVGAESSLRGSEPVATRIASALIRSLFPSASVTSTVCSSSSSPCPRMNDAPALPTLARMSSDWASASRRTRASTFSRFT